jgi:hypothetical protein
VRGLGSGKPADFSSKITLTGNIIKNCVNSSGDFEKPLSKNILFSENK